LQLVIDLSSLNNFHLRSYNRAVASILVGVAALLMGLFASPSLFGLTNIGLLSPITNSDFVQLIVSFFSGLGLYDKVLNVANVGIPYKYFYLFFLFVTILFSISNYKLNIKHCKKRYYGKKLEATAIKSLKAICNVFGLRYIQDDTVYKGVGDIDAILCHGKRIFVIEIKSQGGCKLAGSRIVRMNGRDFIKDYIEQSSNASIAYSRRTGQSSIPVLWFPRGRRSFFVCRNVLVVNGPADYLCGIIKRG